MCQHGVFKEWAKHGQHTDPTTPANIAIIANIGDGGHAPLPENGGLEGGVTRPGLLAALLAALAGPLTNECGCVPVRPLAC